jgi:hypothetical protein
LLATPVLPQASEAPPPEASHRGAGFPGQIGTNAEKKCETSGVGIGGEIALLPMLESYEAPDIWHWTCFRRPSGGGRGWRQGRVHGIDGTFLAARKTVRPISEAGLHFRRHNRHCQSPTGATPPRAPTGAPNVRALGPVEPNPARLQGGQPTGAVPSAAGNGVAGIRIAC